MPTILTTTQDQENLSPTLANLSISGKTPTKDTYSDVDRILINDTLTSVFDRNVYSRESCAIVTDYLGYESDGRSTYRFKAFIEKCNKLINACNKDKPANANAIVFLQTIFDHDETFSDSSILHQIEQLAKSHYIVLRLIGFKEETLGQSINKVAKDLDGRSIIALIVRAHGDQNNIQLSYSNFYTANNVTADDFAAIDLKGTLIFSSCLSGLNLAKKVALIQSRSVFAYTSSPCDDMIISCCDDHGYGAVAFDEFNNQIAKRFTYDKGSITEEAPCCTANKGIEKIKKALLDNKILAAKSGDATAIHYLGANYKLGLNFKQSDETATKLYELAAIHGVVYAQYHLAYSYETGQGITRSHIKAVEWYRKAAEQGYANAQYKLGTYYRDGQVVPQSHKNSAMLYEQAAKHGLAEAQNALGSCYSKEHGVLKSPEKAAIWYERAAKQEYADAQYSLGNCYHGGKGVPKSLEKAAELYTKAAKQGYLPAQFILGYCYHKGEGVPQSLTNAALWYGRAADKGHKDAQTNLNILLKANTKR